MECELDALMQISRLLIKSPPIEELLSQVLAILHENVGMLNGLITFSDQEQSVLQIGAIHCDSDDVT